MSNKEYTGHFTSTGTIIRLSRISNHVKEPLFFYTSGTRYRYD